MSRSLAWHHDACWGENRDACGACGFTPGSAAPDDPFRAQLAEWPDEQLRRALTEFRNDYTLAQRRTLDETLERRLPADLRLRLGRAPGDQVGGWTREQLERARSRHREFYTPEQLRAIEAEWRLRDVPLGRARGLSAVAVSLAVALAALILLVTSLVLLVAG